MGSSINDVTQFLIIFGTTPSSLHFLLLKLQYCFHKFLDTLSPKFIIGCSFCSSKELWFEWVLFWCLLAAILNVILEQCKHLLRSGMFERKSVSIDFFFIWCHLQRRNSRPDCMTATTETTTTTRNVGQRRF